MKRQIAAAPLSFRQTTFARHLFDSMDPLASYRAAGYVSKNDNSARSSARSLAADPRVKSILNDMSMQAMAMSGTTVASLIVELEEARLLAIQVGSASSAATATMGKAKLLGLLIDRSENKVEHTVEFAGASEILLAALGQRSLQVGGGGKVRRSEVAASPPRTSASLLLKEGPKDITPRLGRPPKQLNPTKIPRPPSTRQATKQQRLAGQLAARLGDGGG